MGKQFGFIMDRVDENEFLKMILEDGKAFQGTGVVQIFSLPESIWIKRIRRVICLIRLECRYTDAGRLKKIITKGGIRTNSAYDDDGTEDGLLYDAFLCYELNGSRTGKCRKQRTAFPIYTVITAGH